MSTRSQLAIYESETSPVQNPADGVFLYRHSDGYPESVIPDVLPFLRWFNEKRGISDTSYCAARLMAHLIKLGDTHTAEFLGGIGKTSGNFGETTGFGIDTTIHGDIEFFYHISPTAIRVLDVVNADDVSTWKEVERHSLVKAEVA